MIPAGLDAPPDGRAADAGTGGGPPEIHKHVNNIHMCICISLSLSLYIYIYIYI